MRYVTALTLYRPDSTVQTAKDLAVWVYPPKAAALLEGARLALGCGLEEDPHAAQLFHDGRYQAVLDRYEQTHPDTHLLRVQAAFLQDDRAAELDV